MPVDLDIAYVIAIGMLFGSWASYAPLLGRFGRGTLNSQLLSVRESWVDLSTRRENRTYDAVLFGHIMNSVAFFGSATLIVLAGVVGIFANVRQMHQTIGGLPFVADTGLELFALKVAVLGVVLLISFFSITYALRKFGYTVALLGGLPEQADAHPEHDTLVAATATVLSEAVKSFNSGIRGYYYSIAALFLFVGPYHCMAATAGVMTMLFLRQTRTPTSRAIEKYVGAMDRSGTRAAAIDKSGHSK